MSGDWLLLRRGGLLWAVASRRVRRLERAADGVLVRLDDRLLGGDEVPAVRVTLRVEPLRPLLGRLMPEGSTGLAVWRDEPLLVVDAEHPPAALRRVREGEEEA